MLGGGGGLCMQVWKVDLPDEGSYVLVQTFWFLTFVFKEEKVYNDQKEIIWEMQI